MTATISQTREYMEQIESLRRSHGKTDIQTPYGYILEHGREWGPRVFPKGIRKMTDKLCFMNAYRLSQKMGYRYVEGMANHIIPVGHAWCVNDAGEVIDPTWNKATKHGDPRDYFGVEIPVEKLHAIMLKTKVYGVFGNWMQWEEVLKILKG